MIKAAVFSDTHSSTALMVEAVKRTRPDVIIHLGDYSRDTQILSLEFPEIPLYSVRGNCDIASDSPDTDIVPLGCVKAFICHGHTFSVEWGNHDSLAYAALEAGAKIAMFGHTHEATCEDIGNVVVLNPGTAGKGRVLTYAIVSVDDNGAINCEIKDL